MALRHCLLRKRSFWPLFTAYFAALVLGCEKPPEKSVIRPVKALRVGDLAALEQRDWPGMAQAAEAVNLAFRVSGPLTTFPVKMGTNVKAGDVVATIDPRDFEVAVRRTEASLAQAEAIFEAMRQGARPEEMRQLNLAVTDAEAALIRATADFERAKNMMAQRVISQAEYDRKEQAFVQATARLDSAKEDLAIGQAGARKEDLDAKAAEILGLRAEVEDNKNRLVDATLRAPFDGIITATFVENFETVQAKQPVMRLVATSSVEFAVSIPENLMVLLPRVAGIVCRFDAFGDREFPAVLKEVGTEASEITRTFPVVLEIQQPQDARILPGMSGYATAKGNPESPKESFDGYEIPLSAVGADDKGNSFVWVIDEKAGTVARRNIAMGRLTDHGVLVKELNQGDWIATAGVHFLEPGQKVRILDESRQVIAEPSADETRDVSPSQEDSQ